FALLSAGKRKAILLSLEADTTATVLVRSFRSDDSGALEAFEFVGADSDRPEYFGVMLAKLGRPSHRPAAFGRIGHLNRSAGDADRAPGGIFAVDKHPALSDFRIGDHFLDRAHRRAWNSRLDQSLDHRVARLRAGPIGDDRVEFVGNLKPRAVIFASRIADQLFAPHQFRQCPPMRFGQAEDQYLAVARGIDVGRACAPMTISQTLELYPLQRGRNRAGQRGNRHVEHRDLVMLSAAGSAPMYQRGQDSADQMAAG